MCSHVFNVNSCIFTVIQVLSWALGTPLLTDNYNGVLIIVSKSRLIQFEMVAMAALKDNQSTLFLFIYTWFTNLLEELVNLL